MSLLITRLDQAWSFFLTDRQNKFAPLASYLYYSLLLTLSFVVHVGPIVNYVK